MTEFEAILIITFFIGIAMIIRMFNDILFF